MWILNRLRNAIGAGTFLALSFLLSSVPPTSAQVKGATTDVWVQMRDSVVSSVAWSPDGKHIAFVAASRKDDTDYGVTGATIWVETLPSQHQPTALKRLVRQSGRQGIPCGLFWLDNRTVGWAAAHYSDQANEMAFLQMGLRDRKPRLLVTRTIQCPKDVGDDRGPWAGPADVYYDTASRTLLFTGGTCDENGTNPACVRILPLSTGKIRAVQVPHVRGLVYPKGYVTMVTCSASLRDLKHPLFYVAACMVAESDRVSAWRLWRADSYSLRQDKVLDTAPEQGMLFPRLSPDGKMLACLRVPAGRKPNGIALYDLKSGTRKVLATMSAGRQDLVPATGCPFSWSPTGDRIAYAHGSRVKVIQVIR